MENILQDSCRILSEYFQDFSGFFQDFFRILSGYFQDTFKILSKMETGLTDWLIGHLISHISDDGRNWWIGICCRDEDRERLDIGKLSTPSGSTSSGSEDSVRQRASSSSEASGRQRPPKVSQESRSILSESTDIDEVRMRNTYSESVPSLPSPR